MQQNEPSYSEKQRFRQWWIWLSILISPAFFLGIVLQQIVLGSPVSYVMVILAIVLGGGLPLFIYTMGLDTEVRDCGVCIRFKPFHRKWIVIGFDSVMKAETWTYSPLKDYGGWGIRYGRNAKAYNVSGNKGVMLTLPDEQNLMIGSGNHEVLCSAINERLSSLQEH